LEGLPGAIRDAYRAAFYDRPGVGFVDLPANYIQGIPKEVMVVAPVEVQAKAFVEEARVTRLADAFRTATKPLVVIGKGAAYARAEEILREFINSWEFFLICFRKFPTNEKSA
jgi:2-hydroxyacyl-CoA lyase 1